MVNHATLRFYAELKDFLGDATTNGSVVRDFDVAPAVKDLIESCGVPHTEVELITVEGKSIDFTYRVQDGDIISVYPVFESFDISPIVLVRPEPLRIMRFVADNHLAKLARFLRLVGYDTAHDPGWDDPDLVEISTHSDRILLTRDIELLKHGVLTHGYFVRSTEPKAQLEEVVRRFHLESHLRPYTRCMKCNGLLRPATKPSVEGEVPSRTFESVDDYWRCSSCAKVYWRGSHHSDLMELVEAARSPTAG